MAENNERIEQKETTMKLAEPLRISVKSFAKGHKAEFTINIDPYNSVHLDKLTASLERSEIKQAIKAIHDIITLPIEEGGLGSTILAEG